MEGEGEQTAVKHCPSTQLSAKGTPNFTSESGELILPELSVGLFPCLCAGPTIHFLSYTDRLETANRQLSSLEREGLQERAAEGLYATQSEYPSCPYASPLPPS